MQKIPAQPLGLRRDRRAVRANQTPPCSFMYSSKLAYLVAGGRREISSRPASSSSSAGRLAWGAGRGLRAGWACFSGRGWRCSRLAGADFLPSGREALARF